MSALPHTALRITQRFSLTGIPSPALLAGVAYLRASTLTNRLLIMKSVYPKSLLKDSDRPLWAGRSVNLAQRRAMTNKRANRKSRPLEVVAVYKAA